MQPLLVTAVGVLATVAVVGVVRPFPDVPGENLVGTLVSALGFIVGLLITGFVVGLSSSETRLALLASLVAAIALSLTVAPTGTLSSYGSGLA